MKRDPDDWSRADVDTTLAACFHYSPEQLKALELPLPDYVAAGAAYWTQATMEKWLAAHCTAIHAAHQARDPEGFQDMVDHLHRHSEGGAA